MLTYGSESAAASIEDVGTAKLSDGVANVRIDPAFALLMDRKWYGRRFSSARERARAFARLPIAQ